MLSPLILAHLMAVEVHTGVISQTLSLVTCNAGVIGV